MEAVPAALAVADDRVAWNRLGDDVLVLHLGDSRYYRLNGTGAVLWERLALGSCPPTRDELAGELVAAYGIAPEDAGHDVDTFLGRLTEFGLLTG